MLVVPSRARPRPRSVQPSSTNVQLHFTDIQTTPQKKQAQLYNCSQLVYTRN